MVFPNGSNNETTLLDKGLPIMTFIVLKKEL